MPIRGSGGLSQASEMNPIETDAKPPAAIIRDFSVGTYNIGLVIPPASPTFKPESAAELSNSRLGADADNVCNGSKLVASFQPTCGRSAYAAL